MTDTPLQTVNALKRAHGLRIIAILDQLEAEITSEPELWFGGLPQDVAALRSFGKVQADNMRKLFVPPAE